MKLFWAILALIPSTVFADSLTLPLTAAKLHEYLTTHDLTTKRELLASLPDQFNKRVVLMSDSKSRHKGTRELPRVIHWSPGARFIMAHSGHAPSRDPQANDIEIIQVNETTQSWQFFTMTLTDRGFAAPVDVTRSCAACHGTTPRPIWGPPDAYQGSLGHKGVDRMAPQERQDFSAFVQDKAEHEAYSHLDIRVRESGYALRIQYELPNTHFGARLGTRHASVLFNRLRQSPSYAGHAYRLVRLSGNSRCGRSPEVEAIVHQAYSRELDRSATFRRQWADAPTTHARTELYRLLGIDPMSDARLDHSPVTPVELTGAYTGTKELGWNLGGDGVGALVEFQAFYELLQTDASMQGWFETRRALIDGTHWAAFEASAEEIVAMSELRTGIGQRIKHLDHTRHELVSQQASPAAIAQVDAELATLWAEKHTSRDYFTNGLFPFLHFNIFAPVLEDTYAIYDPMEGEGHKAAFCAYLTKKAVR